METLDTTTERKKNLNKMLLEAGNEEDFFLRKYLKANAYKEYLGPSSNLSIYQIMEILSKDEISDELNELNYTALEK